MKKKYTLSFRDNIPAYAVFAVMINVFVWSIFGDDIYGLYHTQIFYAESVKAEEGKVVNKTAEGFSPRAAHSDFGTG